MNTRFWRNNCHVCGQECAGGGEEPKPVTCGRCFEVAQLRTKVTTLEQRLYRIEALLAPDEPITPAEPVEGIEGAVASMKAAAEAVQPLSPPNGS